MKVGFFVFGSAFHWAAVHTVEPGGQIVARSPQLRLSTQPTTVGEKTSPMRAGLWQRSLHVPAMQLWLLVQILPHAPQLLRSVIVVAQYVSAPASPTPPSGVQRVWPAWQSDSQLFATQSGVPPLHRRPHVPQFVGSEVGSMHAPLQRSVSPTQSTSHVPALHVWSGPHAAPQPPQLAGSAVVSVQVSPQTVRPSLHSPWVASPSKEAASSIAFLEPPSSFVVSGSADGALPTTSIPHATDSVIAATGAAR